MANRILRDWTDSATIDELSWQEEVLFVRLIMKADDYGNFFRNTFLVKSLVFPRKDGLRSSDVERWLKKLEATGLILTYPAKGDTFLHIRNFKQRLDKRTRKHPEEPAIIENNIFPEIPGNSRKFRHRNETKRNETETKELAAPEIFMKMLMEDDYMKQEISMNARKEVTNETIEGFQRHLNIEGKIHDSYKDYRSHFRNWLNKKPEPKHETPEIKKTYKPL